MQCKYHITLIMRDIGIKIIILLLLICQGCKDETATHQVAKEIEHFDNLIVNGEIEYKVYYLFGAQDKISRQSEESILYTFERNNRFVACIDGDKFDYSIILDGENAVSWFKTDRSCLITNIDSSSFINPLALYVRCMSTYLKNANIIRISKIIKPIPLYRIEFVVNNNWKQKGLYPVQPSLDGEYVELLVDPQKQYLPKHIGIYNPKNSLLEELYVESYRIDGNGFWFPAKMTHKNYSDGNERRLYLETKFDIINMRFNDNIVLSDVINNIKFPIGTIISDNRKKELQVEKMIAKYEVLKPITFYELINTQIAFEQGKIVLVGHIQR